MPPAFRLSPDTERLQAALGDRYEVEGEVARGGWAAVYRARDRKHDRVVAIKVFHPELAHALGPERFLQEIRLVARFQHPYILPLHDSGETAESLYYVMPFVEGETLRARLARERRLPVDDALSIARDVLAALAYAHERGVVHRDIKPENVLLSGGRAIVADFGIARAVRAARGVRISSPGIAVGTPAYMAPEQALGGDEADGRSDVYSVGALLFEMLAGRPPFPDTTLQHVVDRHAEETPPPDLRDVRDDVPASLAEAVTRALALTPDARWSSARAFADAITPATTPVAPTWPPATAAAVHGERVRRRRRRIVAIAGVALAAAAAALWPLVRQRFFTPPNPTAIAVFPFTVNGGPEYRYLGGGLVDLLSADLDGAGRIRSVDPHAVLGAAGSAAGPLDPSRARLLAARLGAGRFVLGSVTEESGRLRIRATLYDSRGSGQSLASVDAEGADSTLFDLVDELAAEIIAAERGGPGGRLTRLAAVTTTSLPALKLYLSGEDQLRRGHADSAMHNFGEALQLDSTFGLAAYRRAVAADWAADFITALEAGERARRLGGRLAVGDRQLLDAFLAWHRGDAARAELLYRQVLAMQPDNVEAWYQLGEVMYHYGALRGTSFVASRGPFEKAHALDPQNVSVVLHLLDIAAREGRWEEFDRLRALQREQGTIMRRRLAVRAFAIGTAQERAEALEMLAGQGDGSVVVAVGGIAAFPRDFEGAATVARLLTVPTRAPAARGYGHLLLAQLAYGRGQLREASRELDAAAAFDSVGALELRASAAAARWLQVPLSEVEAVRRRVVAWDGRAPARAPETLRTFTTHDSVHHVLRLYLAAMLAARLNDREGASRLGAQLAMQPVPLVARSLPGDLSRAVSASLAWGRGDDAAALQQLEGIRAEAPMDRVANSPYFGYAHERFMRGELLRALGRDADARGWFESLGEGRHDLMFLAPAQYRLGLIHEKAGDRAAAISAYRTVVRLWRNCDPELRATRDDAAARLARLGGR